MKRYIDKDALLAELDRRNIGYNVDGKHSVEYDTTRKILNIIDTLEVKEVNLEKELNDWRHNHFHGRRDKETRGEYLGRVSQLNLAKHFFELGLSVNNPITAADRGIVDEIIFALNALGEEKMISYDKEIEWLRNKVKKEEKYDTVRNSR